MTDNVYRRVPDGVGPQEFLGFLEDLARVPTRDLLTAYKLTRTLLKPLPESKWFRRGDPVLGVFDSPLPQVHGGLARIGRRPQRSEQFKPTREVANLLANADAVEVAVTWSAGPVRLGGYVWRPLQRTVVRRDPAKPPEQVDAARMPAVAIGSAVMYLNTAQEWTEVFDVVLHELAHVLLGHVGGWSTPRLPGVAIHDRSKMPKRPVEVEAGAAAYVASLRRGAKPRGVQRKLWVDYFYAFLANEIQHIDLHQIVHVADTLTTWCDEPPDAVSVSPPSGPQRPILWPFLTAGDVPTPFELDENLALAWWSRMVPALDEEEVDRVEQ